MGQLTVDPGSLESASATLRGTPDHGAAMLARALVDDVRTGISGPGWQADTEGFGSALPQLVESVTEQTATIAGHLSTAAGAYRRTEWLVRVALAEQP